MTMTLEGVAADLERLGFKGYASAIRAHLAQSGQSADAEKVREVIAELRVYAEEETEIGTREDAVTAMADKLTAALQEKGNG